MFKFFGKTLAVFLAAAVASLLATTGAVSPAIAGVSAHVLSSGDPLAELIGRNPSEGDLIATGDERSKEETYGDDDTIDDIIRGLRRK
ncbi:MAG: hypothetical protein AB4352_11265 [Hormoscilla sp.]